VQSVLCLLSVTPAGWGFILGRYCGDSSTDAATRVQSPIPPELCTRVNPTGPHPRDLHISSDGICRRFQCPGLDYAIQSKIL
jgi:hypothetical protein